VSTRGYAKKRPARIHERMTRFVDFSRPLGTFDWEDGFGAIRYCDPQEQVVSILRTKPMFKSLTS
jgi:hypothetical protein